MVLFSPCKAMGTDIRPSSVCVDMSKLDAISPVASVRDTNGEVTSPTRTTILRSAGVTAAV
jgi:hypothetical protein